MNGIITSTLTFAAPLLLKMVSGTGMGGNQPQESEETNTEYEGMQTFAPAFGDPIVSNNSDNDKIPAGSQNHYITYAPNPIVEETTTKPVEKNPNQSTNILSNGNNGIVHPTPTSSSHVKVDPTHANQIKDPTMNTKVDTNKTGNASTNSNIVVTHPMHVINTTTTKNSNIGVTSRPCPIIQTTIKNDVSNHFSQENFEDTTNTLPTPKPTSKEINQPSQIVTHPVNVINTTTTNNSNIGVTRRPCPLIQTTIKNDVSNHFSHEDNRNSLPTLKPTPIELSQNNQAPLKLICECTDKVNHRN